MDHQRADHHGHRGIAGNAQREHRNERGLRARVVGRLGRGDAANVAMAETARRSRDVLLQRVGGERGKQRAPSRKHAEHRTERRTAQDRAEAIFEIIKARPHPADSKRNDAALPLVLEVVGDFGDAVDRHRERHEFDAVS